MHDARYRTVFAFPRMVEDLLRGFAAREWADALDFSTLRKVPADYVSDERLSRRGDAVWQVRFHDGRPVLAVLEFQSSDDPRMALRILACPGPAIPGCGRALSYAAPIRPADCQIIDVRPDTVA